MKEEKEAFRESSGKGRPTPVIWEEKWKSYWDKGCKQGEGEKTEIVERSKEGVVQPKPCAKMTQGKLLPYMLKLKINLYKICIYQ